MTLQEPQHRDGEDGESGGEEEATRQPTRAPAASLERRSGSGTGGNRDKEEADLGLDGSDRHQSRC